MASYLFATEYYATGDLQPDSRWIGKGAEALGLAGPVDRASFQKLLDGYAPDGTALRQNAGAADARLGYDLEMSASKAFSLLVAAADEPERQRLLAAFDRSCDAGTDWLLGQLETRRGHGGAERLPVAATVMAAFTHYSSREGDVDIHRHGVLLNVAQGADGRWATFDGEPLKTLKQAAGALAEAELCQELRRMGYAIEGERELDADGRETGQVWHRVAGTSKEERLAFSRRREEIMAAVGPDATAWEKQKAALETRKEKEHGEPPSALTLAANRERMEALRKERGLFQWTASDLKRAQGRDLKPLTDAQILDRLHATESHWTRADLIRRLARERGGTMGASAVLKEADDFLKRNQVLALAPDRHGRERFASREQLRLERGIGERALAGKDDQAVRVDAAKVADAIRQHERRQGFTLTAEQRKAVAFVASDTGRVACLQGYAGSGKTATAGAYIGAFQADGRQVIGAATAWKAAEKLRSETGLETYSTASLIQRLERGTLALDQRSVIVLDEAGMVGARTVSRIMDYTEAAGAKLVMLGDPQQLQPVEASAAFTLAGRATGIVQQTEIRRQRLEADRETARAFYGEATGAAIVQRMAGAGQLREADSAAEARAALVRDYMADPAEATAKIVIAPTNAQAATLTQGIRAAMKARGDLQHSEAVMVRGALKGETRTIDLAPGDRVRFTKRDRDAGVVNGDAGIVEAIEHQGDGHRVRVRLESDIPGKDGQAVEIQSGAACALAYNYAGTVHRAQGQGKRSVYWLAQGAGMDRNLGLVAFTRETHQLRAYTADREALAERLDEWRMKDNAVDLAPHAPTYASLAATIERGDILAPKRQEQALERTAPEQVQKARTLPPASRAPVLGPEAGGFQPFAATVAKEAAWVKTQPEPVRRAWERYQEAARPGVVLLEAEAQQTTAAQKVAALAEQAHGQRVVASALEAQVADSRAVQVAGDRALKAAAKDLAARRPRFHLGAKWKAWQQESERLQVDAKSADGRAKEDHAWRKAREEERKQAEERAKALEAERRRADLERRATGARIAQEREALALRAKGAREAYEAVSRPPEVRQALEQHERERRAQTFSRRQNHDHGLSIGR